MLKGLKGKEMPKKTTSLVLDEFLEMEEPENKVKEFFTFANTGTTTTAQIEAHQQANSGPYYGLNPYR